MQAAIVVLTFNRVHLLRQCVENVLGRTSGSTAEIVIWNNGSTDGTREFLDALVDPRITVVHHDRNIGPNAYDEAFARTSAEYLIELDDDVIDAPEGWDSLLLTSLRRLPDEYALLSANLVNNPHDATAQLMYGRDADRYRVVVVNGVELKIGGPIGGGCAIISRSTYNKLDGFGQSRRPFWDIDAVVMRKIRAAGLHGAYLRRLEVLHAGGVYYAPLAEAKLAAYRAESRREARRNAVKRVLLWMPLVRRLNERRRWFYPPTSA